MPQIIGFATEFYTLWDYSTESVYTTDAYGNHHCSGIKHNYYYLQNISKDLSVVKVKFPGVSIDDSLRGKHRSFDRVEKIELPAEYLPFGKHQGKLISDVAKTDMKYLLWFLENGPSRTTNLIKELPEVIAYFEQQESDRKSANGEPVILSSGTHIIPIISNGRSDFHIPDEKFDAYEGRPYMVGMLENEKGFATNIKIILNDVKEVGGMYPYLMPIINGKAQKTKNKSLSLDIDIIDTYIGLYEITQIAVLR